STIQIVGIPDAYSSARQLVDFNDSPKDWTFESLDALQNAIKKAISTYNWKALDQYKSKVNFFATNWNQETSTTENGQEDFSMRSFMRGNSIHFNSQLDDTSNPNEAYLRTWGWSQYISIWYLYFRKVNFPVDPEIHGHWEWAGIYFGEKL
ncbi:MAG: tetratricopeptide repeat protein, partial [Treponema sp.]|nr:tetratricopeptide repeat protein [Treponema sp.]